METSAAGVTLIAFFGLALGLTYISSQVRMLPFSFGASIAWLVPLIALATGVLGPGIGVLWVQAICLVFVMMAFSPLLLQMRTEVRHEKRMGDGGVFNWSAYQKRGWTPDDLTTSQDKFKNNLRDISKRAGDIRRNTQRARANQAARAKQSLNDF